MHVAGKPAKRRKANRGTVIVSPAISKHMALERLAVIRDLVRRGYSVRVPMADAKQPSAISAFWDAAKGVGAKKMWVSPDSPYADSWIRDSFSYVGDMRHLDNTEPWVYDLLNNGPRARGGLREGRIARGSPLHEGGNIIPLGNGLYIRGISFGAGRSSADGKIRDGNAFFKLVVPRHVAHIDMVINAIPHKKILLVGPELQRARKIIGSIAEQAGLKILEIPQEEAEFCPANFIDLPDGRIMVNRAAGKTIAMLRKAGVKAIPSPVPPAKNIRAGGSLRCFTNLPRRRPPAGNKYKVKQDKVKGSQ